MTPARNAGKWEYLTFAAYVSLISFTISRHEPWFDEAQAWLLARDAGPLELFWKYLRYEGHTGLWYAILLLPAKLGLPYITLHIISGIIAAAGVFIFLRCAPFPLGMKLLFPFTFFIVYQYAVVARSYVMYPLFLFITAILYPQATRRIYVFIFLLCLIANVSLHGVLIALSILLAYSLELYPRWRTLEPDIKRRHLIAYAALALVIIAILLEMRQPPDAAFATGYVTSIRFIAVRAISLLIQAMTGRWYISAVVYLISLWWFWKKGLLLLFVTAIGLVLCLAAIKYTNAWHQGILFLVWTFVMWLSLARNNGRAPAVIAAVWVVVMLFNIYWGYRSIRCDAGGSYSASREVAQYIRQNHLERKRIYAFGFHSMSILPWFPENIFDNYNHKRNPSYWFWSTSNHMDDTVSAIPAERPDVLIFGVKFDAQQKLERRMEQTLPALGYTLAGRFDGNLCWKNKTLEKDAFVVFRRPADQVSR